MNDPNLTKHPDNKPQDNDVRKARNEIKKSVNRFFENTKKQFRDAIDDLISKVK
jgi:hypothetical protein